MRRIDLKQLHYFITVCELGSFSRAAARLSIAQPTLSRQISSLEKELGDNLLYRNGRGIVLTESGQKFLRHARDVEKTFSLAMNELSSMRETPVGQTTIGMPPSVSGLLAVQLVRQFQTHFPKVTLRILEGFSGNVLEWLATGRVDVAILYDVPGTATFVTEPLAEEELILVGSPKRDDHPLQQDVHAQTLAQLSYIFPSPSHGLRTLLDGVAAKGGWSWSVALEIDTLPVTLALVADGAGYAILPPTAIAAHCLTLPLRVWTISKPRILRKLVLATTTQRPMTLATRHLARLVRQQARKLAEEGGWQ